SLIGHHGDAAMSAWNPEANDLFLEVLDRPSPEERRAFLEVACRGRPELRAQVDALLAASERAGTFLSKPVVVLGDTPLPFLGPVLDPSPCGGQFPANPSRPAAESPGTCLGPYKLLEQIGEGGMGVVYLAEQERPVRRRVALKILKPGMDSKAV